VQRWPAAQGLVLSTRVGRYPFSDAECTCLFDRLQDDDQWSAVGAAKPVRRMKRSGS